MATNIQSQSHTELKAFLEERLRAQFPSANGQEIANAVEVAMGRRGYVFQQQQRENGQRENGQRENNQRENGQRENGQRNNQQQDLLRRENGQGGYQQSASLSAIASVRDAAISAAQAISEPSVKMAAVAAAWTAFAATSVLDEQNKQSEQKASRN